MKNKTFILKIYAISLTFILIIFLFSGFKTELNTEKFQEITVERINVVTPDGHPVMVISNSERQHPGMMDGKLMPDRKRPPGMIFFNEDRDEVGGLIYEGNQKDGAGMVLSFDQLKNDQVMQLRYVRNENGQQQYGMNLWDRSENFPLTRLLSVLDSLQNHGITNPKEITETIKKMNNGHPVAAERMFTGKNFNDHTGIFIKDELGNERISIFVDKNNVPHFQILDENCTIVKEFVEK